MALKLMYITNSPEIARICEKHDVDRIFIDLETIGKAQRQGWLDTVKSMHSIEDIDAVKSVLTNTEVLVRVNPINVNSVQEINKVAESNADIVMLPYFKTVEEVKTFLKLLGGRKRSCLLFETPDSVMLVDEILALDGIDEVFIGLNDLHLGYERKFMFELLADGTVEALCDKFKQHKLPFGFGGVARPDQGMLKGKYIIGEHYRLGSSAVILSRSFCNYLKAQSIEEVENTMKYGVAEIRKCQRYFEHATDQELEDNKTIIAESVNAILATLCKEN